MRTTTHVIKEQGSSSGVKFPKNLRSLLPLPRDENSNETPCVLELNHHPKLAKKTYEVLVGENIMEVKDCNPTVSWRGIGNQNRIISRPPDIPKDLVDKQVVHEGRV